MHISVKDLVGGDAVVGGALAGRALLAKLIGQVGNPESPTVVFLDMAGIEIATLSFLRESVIAFRDYVRGRGLHIYPVLANLAGVVAEEVDVFLRERSDAMLTCSLGKTGKVADLVLLGALDPKQRIAYDSVIDMGRAEATDLWAKHKKAEKIGITAWNNRLASLSARGLLIAESSGRSKSYIPVLKVS